MLTIEIDSLPPRFNGITPVARGLALLIAASLFLFVFDNIFFIQSIPFIKTPSALFAFFAFGLFLLGLASGWTIQRSGTAIAVFILAYISFVELINGSFLDRSLLFSRHMQWVQPLIFFIMALHIVRNGYAVQIFLKTFIITLAFIAICVLLNIEYFTSVALDRTTTRRGFSGLNLNNEAFYYAAGIVICVWRILHAPRLPSLKTFGTALLCLLFAYSLFNTGSRGGLLVMVIGLATLLFHARHSIKLSQYMLFIPVLIGALTALYISNDQIQDRMNRLLFDQHYSGRDLYFWTSIELFLESPWFGYGSSIYDVMGVSLERYRPRATHNGILQVLLTYGAGALVLWVILLQKAYRAVRKFRHTPEGSLAVALLVLSLANHAVADMAFDRFFWVLLAICINFRFVVPHAVRAGRTTWSLRQD